MKRVDDDTMELSYEEYKEKAKELKDEGWPFQVYPPRPGVTYVWAYNAILRAHRILTTTEYLALKKSGAWDRGVDRLKGSPSGSVRRNEVKIKKDPRYAKAVEKLITMDKNCKTFEELKAELNKVITFMVTPD